MSLKRVRNDSFVPYLDYEGVLVCPLPTPPPVSEGKRWYDGLSTYDRLFYHQTLASVRQSKRYVATPEVPRDSLDFQLQSRYNHSREIFPQKVDSVLQRETCSGKSVKQETFRVLRNTRLVDVKKPPELGHPLRIGGIVEKVSPHSVKLINSGPHTQLVNNGYSRQPADGNFFRY